VCVWLQSATVLCIRSICNKYKLHVWRRLTLALTLCYSPSRYRQHSIAMNLCWSESISQKPRAHNLPLAMARSSSGGVISYILPVSLMMSGFHGPDGGVSLPQQLHWSGISLCQYYGRVIRATVLGAKYAIYLNIPWIKIWHAIGPIMRQHDDIHKTASMQDIAI